LQSINCAAFPEPFWNPELFGPRKRLVYRRAEYPYPASWSLRPAAPCSLMSRRLVPLNTGRNSYGVLQSDRFEGWAGTKTIPVDIRIVAATNKNLEEAIKQGTFRDDLFYLSTSSPSLSPRSVNAEKTSRHWSRSSISRSGRPKSVEERAMKLIRNINGRAMSASLRR